ncbi:alpha-L-fucosidase [Puniceicoccaceae bacterium K14]|nr:alpha-L-fucosidase [Puniceicoccaceae bacterium K14]
MKMIRMYQFLRRITLSLFLLTLGGQINGAEFYVSTNVDRSGDGSIERPFVSLPHAVKAARDLREKGASEPVTIYLREGRHQLNETLVLNLKDGSPLDLEPIDFDVAGAGAQTGPAYLTIAAYPGEKPIVSGGVPIKGWKQLDTVPSGMPTESLGNVWVADMPEGLDRFYTLFDEQGRLTRARNSGFAPRKEGNKKTLYFPKGALKDWDNLEDVEIQVRPYRPWVINMLPLASVDEEAGVATTGVSATYQMDKLPPWVHNPGGSSVWVENILEALDEPGEWVVNTQTRKIYLWPLNPASDGSPHGILAPTTSELIRVEGSIDYEGPTDTPVRGIAFSGLTFTHADRWAWTSDESRLGWGMQHDWDMFDRPTAMLRFRGTEDCRVTDCRFIDSGGTGFRMDLHAQRNRVENCEFSHLGEAGILLAGYGPGSKDVNHHNEIVNNHIHHFSEITWHSPGIWAWQSGRNRIAHNYVHHSGYAAVLITNRVEPDRNLDGEGGRTVRHDEILEEDKVNIRESYENWKVREKYNHARYNLLEYNEITHSVQKLSDGNAIYVSGAGTGNIVRYNYIHDNYEHSLPAAIRCDDDQHEVLIYGNVLYNNYGFSAGIASKGINDIINNFIVAPLTSPKWGYVSFEWTRVTGSEVRNNIIMSHPSGGNAYGERPIERTEDGHPLVTDTEMNSNLYWNPNNSKWMDAHFEKMRAIGKEQSSRFCDPLFVDPAKGDFRFRPDSPALALGIEELDVSKMGIQKTDDINSVDYITQTGGKVDFGKTDSSAYIPEIRENMKKLYHDKIGLFVHFGPYAQLGGVWNDREIAAEWIMRRGEIPISDYEEHAAGLFKPDRFDASEWVDIAEQAGMKFIVVTAKHHDGFAMYDSDNPYNLVNFAGFGRDILKELSVECAERDMNLGFYYSQSQDWHEEGAFGNSWDFEGLTKPQDKFDAYFESKAVPQVEELTKNYGDIFMVWFDTPVQMDDEKCQQMMDIVGKNQPGALVNSRLGQGFGHFDVSIDNGKTPSVSTATWLPDLKVPWQTHESVTQRGWGYTTYGGENDRSEEYTDFVYSLCRIVCYGGVYLLNVGPRPDGTIPESQVNSLRAIGEWLEVNGEAIYGADPSPLKFPPYAITSKPGKIYLHLKELEDGKAELDGLLSTVTNAYCLADTEKRSLYVDQNYSSLRIKVPEELIQPRITVVVLEIEDEIARVVDETLQQADNGVITLPVSRCEFAIRRISYDYENEVTHRWGENTKQGLVWTVNVKSPGRFKVISEDNGNSKFVYELSTVSDSVSLEAKGNIGRLVRKEHDSTIEILETGVQTISVYPTTTIGMSSQFKFKGLELVPVD